MNLALLKTIPAEVTLVVVSKTRTVDEMIEAYRHGVRDFGENYPQELCQKAEEFQTRGITDIRWHLIGHLQTNKVKKTIPWVHTFHALDSIKLAEEIAKRIRENPSIAPLPTFLAVNIDREPTKSGILPEDLPAFRKAIEKIPEIQLLGLMCIPDPKRADLAEPFHKLRVLALPGERLSMGMSDDYESAIAEGATHIRIGSAIFGPRS